MTSGKQIPDDPADHPPLQDPAVAAEPGDADDFTLAAETGDIMLTVEAGADRFGVGMAVIAQFARALPNAPGVYRMFDGKGDVLYVGKARSLKKRVQQYAQGRAHTNQVARMIAETASMEFVTTQTETEALLLEANLIKQLRPRYNVLLRDDKSFPYILLTRDHASPQILKHRGARVRKGDYFGPFASAGAVDRTIDALQRAFLLRSCSDSVFENRTRPCLLFQIKRCAAPCVAEIAPPDYAALVNEATDFLAGRSMAVRKRLSDEMQAASEALEFERAARARDRLAAMSAIQSNQDINPQNVEEADVFAIHQEAGHFCVEVFFFRNWQNWGNRAFSPKADRSLSLGEVLGAFVTQFYDDKPTPKLILLSQEIEEHDLIADAFSQRAGRKIEIATPKRGERRDLVAHAEKNAKEALSRKLADTASQEKLLASLGAAFGLAKPPRRVEVYDNSHIMGTNAVGAMIVAGPQGFAKTHYRTFNVKSTELTPGDDFGMMREMLQRRFARLAKEAQAAQTESANGSGAENGADLPIAESEIATAVADEDVFPSWPDLVIIDGGKGQLEAAREMMAATGARHVPLVAIAKGPDRNAGQETFFQPDRAPFKLPPRDPALYFIQRLRDEAHRFAIGTHRAKRSREISKNPLDEIPGIGPRRKRALLLHFGTVKAIKNASLEDLAHTPGVNDATAKAVYRFFHDGA